MTPTPIAPVALAALILAIATGHAGLPAEDGRALLTLLAFLGVPIVGAYVAIERNRRDA